MDVFRLWKLEISHITVTALATLLLGAIYYWLARSHNSAVFLSLLPALPLKLNFLFLSSWLGWLPSFIHVFAFSLLTYVVLGHRHILFASILWGTINGMFEMAQALPVKIIQQLPEFLNIRSYFVHGVFDPLDLGACFIGAWAAWMICHKRTLRDGKG